MRLVGSHQYARVEFALRPGRPLSHMDREQGRYRDEVSRKFIARPPVTTLTYGVQGDAGYFYVAREILSALIAMHLLAEQ